MWVSLFREIRLKLLLLRCRRSGFPAKTQTCRPLAPILSICTKAHPKASSSYTIDWELNKNQNRFRHFLNKSGIWSLREPAARCMTDPTTLRLSPLHTTTTVLRVPKPQSASNPEFLNPTAGISKSQSLKLNHGFQKGVWSFPEENWGSNFNSPNPNA